MKIHVALVCLLLLFSAIPAAGEDLDYLSRMAERSEIKAIAQVTAIRLMGANRDGTLYQVTFKPIYDLTPYIPNPFTGGCKSYEYAWQQHSNDMVYFKPRKGQRVYVTVSANGGAITSLTPLTPRLEAVIRKTPDRLAYHRGEAFVRPGE